MSYLSGRAKIKHIKHHGKRAQRRFSELDQPQNLFGIFFQAADSMVGYQLPWQGRISTLARNRQPLAR
jgi:hypothetical protein